MVEILIIGFLFGILLLCDAQDKVWHSWPLMLAYFLGNLHQSGAIKGWLE